MNQIINYAVPTSILISYYTIRMITTWKRKVAHTLNNARSTKMSEYPQRSTFLEVQHEDSAHGLWVAMDAATQVVHIPPLLFDEILLVWLLVLIV